MRIQFTLSDSCDPNAGGMGVTAGLTEVYRELGHEVDLLCHNDLPRSLSFQAKAVLFPALVAWRLRNASVDVIDSNMGDSWLLGKVRGDDRPPPLICRSHGIAYTAAKANRDEAERGNIELSWKFPFYWGGPRIQLEAWSMRSASLSLFLNSKERDIAVNRFEVPAERTRIVDNGISNTLIGLPLEDLEPREGSLRIAHIGRYLPHKGTQYLNEALDLILDRHPEARATLLGTVCDPAETLADFKEEHRSRIDIVSTFRREDLPQILAGHGVILSSSLREAWLLGALEGMACGLVPVITDIPGPTQYVTDAENGLVVPPADGDALAGAVERLIADPELFTRLRENAHSSAQRYSWERIGKQTLELYEEAAELRSGARE